VSISFKKPSILPGFWPAFSYTILYLSLIVLIPLSAVFLKSVTSSWSHLWQVVTSPEVAAKYASRFAKVQLFTIDEVFGGWQKAQKRHFSDDGMFDQIYQPGK